jgi:hypothetical protein
MVQHGHIMDIFVCALDQVRGRGARSRQAGTGGEVGELRPTAVWMAAGRKQALATSDAPVPSPALTPQPGLYEMKELVQLTGGMVVQIDTFANVVFKESLKRVFAKEGEEGFLGSSSCATLEVLPSRDIKVGEDWGPAGVWGRQGTRKRQQCLVLGQAGCPPAAPNAHRRRRRPPRPHPHRATRWRACWARRAAWTRRAPPSPRPRSGRAARRSGRCAGSMPTPAWRCSSRSSAAARGRARRGRCARGGRRGADDACALAGWPWRALLERPFCQRCSALFSSRHPTPQGEQLFIQFITRYLHWSGALRCRVTTLTRFWTAGDNSADLLGGFDQEAAAVVGGGFWGGPGQGRGEQAGQPACGFALSWRPLWSASKRPTPSPQTPPRPFSFANRHPARR